MSADGFEAIPREPLAELRGRQTVRAGQLDLDEAEVARVLKPQRRVVLEDVPQAVELKAHRAFEAVGGAHAASAGAGAVVEPDVHAFLVLKVFLQDVHISISIEIADPRLVAADAGGEQLGLEMAFAIAVEDPLPAVGTGAGIVHFAGIDIQVAVAVDVADPQSVAVIDPLDEHVLDPLALAVLI